MALVIPDTAKVLMLKYILNVIGQDGATAPTNGQRLLRLFTNNLYPDEDTVIGDITEASGATGYEPVTLQGAGWTFTLASHVCTGMYSEQLMEFTTRVTVYGYYVTTTEGTPKMLWAERLSDGPYILPVDGGVISIRPKLTGDQA